MKEIPIIVQARLSSNRLPNKVLRKLNEFTIIEWVYHRLSLVDFEHRIIVATSSEVSDDELADFCQLKGFEVFRGSLKNVALRFKTILDTLECRFFFRICADSPFIDPALLNYAYQKKTKDMDLITNVMKRTFPKGQSVELINKDAFLQIYHLIESSYDKEHVTSKFYESKNSFNIFNFESDIDYSNIQLSIDTQEDFAEAKKLLSHIDNNRFTINELIEIGKQIS